jgi:hypothetical protein
LSSNPQTTRTEASAVARRLVVSSAQKSAAEAMVKRSAVTGRPVSESVRRIANAKVVRGTTDGNSPTSGEGS